MFELYADRRSDRLVSMAGVAVMHIALGWVLISGLGADMVRGVSQSLQTFNVAPPPPPPIEETPAPQTERAAPEEAAPAAPPAPAAEEKAPAVEPTPGYDVPPPVAAGLVPSGPAGSAGSAGPGTGSGAGGQGIGTGAGGSGSGPGGGGSRAELVSGQIVRADYPRAALEARAEGRVEVRFMVGPDGRVRNCRVSRSSGNPALDQTTCRLVEQRFRWTPARDGRGNPVAEERGWQQTWWFERRARTTRRRVDPAEKGRAEPQNGVRETIE